MDSENAVTNGKANWVPSDEGLEEMRLAAEGRWIRADGRAVCEYCGKPFEQHPAYKDTTNVLLCDGRVAHL